MFVVNNGDRFTVGPGLDKASLKFGRAEVTYEAAGDQMTASAVSMLTITAGPGAEAPVVGAAAGDAAGAAGGAAAGAGGAVGGAAGGVAPGVPAAPPPAPGP
jgi:hypothetical protein